MIIENDWCYYDGTDFFSDQVLAPTLTIHNYTIELKKPTAAAYSFGFESIQWTQNLALYTLFFQIYFLVAFWDLLRRRKV